MLDTQRDIERELTTEETYVCLEFVQLCIHPLVATTHLANSRKGYKQNKSKENLENMIKCAKKAFDIKVVCYFWMTYTKPLSKLWEQVNVSFFVFFFINYISPLVRVKQTTCQLKNKSVSGASSSSRRMFTYICYVHPFNEIESTTIWDSSGLLCSSISNESETTLNDCNFK